MRPMLLLFILLHSLAQADPPLPVWNCQIFADLSGRTQHYMFYGRDSWAGEGGLYCESGASTVYKPVTVSFNSMYDGFGADANSPLQLLIALKTQMPPAELQIRSVVEDSDRGPQVVWTYASQLSEARVFVINSTAPPVTRSLQSGTLFIRSSGD